MNACDATDLDADALLPPRKRLLAGLKRQSSDVNFPVMSNSSNAGSEFDVHLNHLLGSQLSNPNTTIEEIVEASRHAATEAAKIAGIARANAEDKAAKAAKAVAAAKNALELVATLSEEASKKEHRLKKNKLKKHIPVESLYSKIKGKTNCRADEELARNLHRSINSSPRISKSLPSSDAKTHKHKKIKSSACYEKTHILGGGLVGEGNRPSIAISTGNCIQGEVSTKGPVKEIEETRVDLNTPRSDKVGKPTLFHREESHPSTTDRTKLEHREIEVLNSKDKVADTFDGFGKKRGRVKQKKLPLSICSFRDKTGPKEWQKSKGLRQSEDNSSGVAAGNRPTFPDSLIPVERTSVWKCQAFKAPACVKQNKVIQS
ncbi:hypothetical protein F511_14000 [Dorcoceras hygrometricum]|uniref:Uncharacterized protein n=1 Tax=Dorcoceras hygrometricum TaxID=472368 RepID=A0A2Z7C289_9LAMI|nr:hypothetical protein F511_14000 [Dorcoceras hygrometricum]